MQIRWEVFANRHRDKQANKLKQRRLHNLVGKGNHSSQVRTGVNDGSSVDTGRWCTCEKRGRL